MPNLNTVLNSIANMPTKRSAWLVLCLSAFVFECAALYFQYVMGLEPCVMCIYQRVAVLGIFVSTLPALFAPNHAFMRTVSYAGWLTAAIWGADIAYEHLLMQNPDNFLLAMSCDVYPNFPSWFAIHQWLPAVFEARGTCDTIDWVFAGLSMPEWMFVIFVVNAITAVLLLSIRLLKVKRL